MVHEEFISRFHEFTSVPFSADAASAFVERLILCPTQEAARACVRKDLVGALSFVLALQGIQQRLEKNAFDLPAQMPKFHTRFYLIASAVQDYLDSLRVQPVPVEQTSS